MTGKKNKPDKELIKVSQERREHFNIFINPDGKDINVTSYSGKKKDAWDSITFAAAQLTKPPIDFHKEHVDLSYSLGGRFSPAVKTDLPVMVAGMSYGALTKSSKLAIHRALNILARDHGMKIFYNTGEGGVLPHELEDRDYLLMVQVASGRFNVNLESLLQADAIEIKIGQGAKPGIGGQLPGNKVTKEIARLRGIPEGVPAYSPARNMDIIGPEDLFAKIQELRIATGGNIPIGVKIAATDVYHDAIIASRMADFITVDGMSAGTGAAPEIAQSYLGIQTIPAIAEARKGSDDMAAQLYKTLRRMDRTVDFEEISLIISGGIIFSPEMYISFALGANMVSVGTAIELALGCTACHSCHDHCPVYITTDGGKEMDIDAATENIVRYFERTKRSLELLYAANGHYLGNSTTPLELRTTDYAIHRMTNIPMPGANVVKDSRRYAARADDQGGCGIAAIIPSEKKLEAILSGKEEPLPVNKFLHDMMKKMQNRGPDSAGVAFYYYKDIPENRYRLKIRFDHENLQEIEAIIKRYSEEQTIHESIPKTPKHYEKGIDIKEFVIYSDMDSVLRALSKISKIPDLTLISFGNYSDVIKDVGKVDQLYRLYGLDRYENVLYGIGHVRTATMTGVNPVTAHPFSTSVLPDITVVHNGEVSNATRLKNKLQIMGYPFFAPTDSEVIASFIAERINRGYSLEDAAKDFVDRGDGPYSFLVATPEGVAFVKDRNALRPAIMGYNPGQGFYAVATDIAALNKVGAHEDLNFLSRGGVHVFKTGIRR
ncbi:MAG: hypothetical protein GXP63_06065 [DPANN group archaeon]|nr:hypothetical protein [DPANN group archaeon]